MLRRVLTGQQMSVLGGARGIRSAVARLPNMRLSTSAAAAPAEAPAGEAAPAAVEEVADFNKPYSSSPAALTWSAWLELKQQQEKLYDQVTSPPITRLLCCANLLNAGRVVCGWL
jgi:hypothetical protein